MPPTEPSAAPPPSDRTRVRRLPARGRYDRESIEAIIDASIVGHVGYVMDGQPYVTATSVWRQGDRLYWHGSSASRAIRASQGMPVCITVTLLDGLVLARSGFDHSLNYRSVMVLGEARDVSDEAEKLTALEAFTERLYPGRWATLRPATRRELKATAVLWVDLREASAKVREGGPHDEPGDESWPVWAGTFPLRTVAGPPEPDEHVPPGMAPPALGPALEGDDTGASTSG
jgi:uncharacterized protein